MGSVKCGDGDSPCHADKMRSQRFASDKPTFTEMLLGVNQYQLEIAKVHMTRRSAFINMTYTTWKGTTTGLLTPKTTLHCENLSPPSTLALGFGNASSSTRSSFSF